MRVVDIIEKKRDNNELSIEEINYFISGFTNGAIPDYQASALLMAIYLNGMNQRETVDLTMAMANSGDVMDLSKIAGIKVDKHSTGGVGDKTTLVVGPLAAAAGVPIAKMSGRGLGHTGGTIDKLESIPGFKIDMQMNQFVDNVNKYGIAIAGQTGNLVPADKKIYALRDVTGTISNISLIASSIMSKKIAAGSDAILLDVKTGSGAFMKSKDDAFNLAKEMVDIGTNVGRNTVAIITDMNQPLGSTIGNSLEVIEAIDTLKGNGPEDFEEICVMLAGYIIYLGEKASSFEEGEKIAREKLQNGEGLQKLRQLIDIQGGNSNVIDDYSIFPKADITHIVKAENEGFVSEIDAHGIGVASMILGGGRETKDSKIDYSVGLKLLKKVGDKLEVGDVLATIYGNDQEKVLECQKILQSSYRYSNENIVKTKLIYGIVSKDGVQKQ